MRKRFTIFVVAIALALTVSALATTEFDQTEKKAPQEFAVAPGKSVFSAAFDGKNYLVALSGLPRPLPIDSNVSALLISSTGSVIGEEISTKRPGSYPSIAFDGKKYLLVWCDHTNSPNDIYGQFISTSGSLVGTPFPVSLAQGRDIHPRVAFGGGNYLVVWNDTNTPDNPTVYGQQVSMEGALLGDPIELSETTGKNPLIAFSGDNFLVTWSSTNGSVSGQIVNAGAGEKIGGNFLFDTAEHVSDRPIYLIHDGTRYVMSIPVHSENGWKYMAIAIDSDGKIISKKVLPDNGNAAGFGGLAGFDGINYLAFSYQSGLTIQSRFFDRNFDPVGGWTPLFAIGDSKIPLCPVAVFGGGRYFVVSTRASCAPDDKSLSNPDSYGIFLKPLCFPGTNLIQAEKTPSAASGAKSPAQAPVATPRLTAGGTYAGPKTVTVTCATPGATIYYTTNGVDPTQTSIRYTGPITLNKSTTLKARAYKNGMSASSIATASYTLKPSTPVISPAGGTFNGPRNVTISCATSGATIRYTTNGTDPNSSSTVYKGPINISKTTTLKARAFKAGMISSNPTTATFTINASTGINGTYSGYFHSVYGDTGTIYLTVTQSGTYISGKMTISGGDCPVSNLSYTGIVSGSKVNMTCSQYCKGMHLTLYATTTMSNSGKTLSGQYLITGGGQTQDYGTITLNKK